MKKVVLLVVVILISIIEIKAEESFAIRFYTKNEDKPRIININSLDKISFKNINNKYLMKLYHLDSLTASYPVVAVDSVKFGKDSSHLDIVNIYLFGSQRSYLISEMDSIVFSEIENKINEDVVLVDSIQSKKIIYLDSAVLILDKSSPLVNDLKQGDIITGEPSDNAPDGFLKRVKSIKTEGDSIIVETENSKITDVIESGIISFEIEFTPQDTTKQKFKRQGNEIHSQEGFTIGFSDIVIYDDDGNKDTESDQIKIDGSNTFTPKLGFNLVVQDWKVIQLLIQLTMKNSLALTAYSNLEFEKTFQESLNELLGIPAIQLPPVVVPVGVCPVCIPVTITSNIDLQVGVTINVGSEVSSGINLENSAIAGIEFNSGTWKKISEQTSSFDFSPPELSLGGSIKPFVGPQLNISFFNLQDAFNAYVNIFGFGELDVDILNKPLWQLWAGIEANAGVESEWWDELDYELPFVLEYRKLLAQATDLISNISPIEAKVGDEITISGSGFGNTRGSSYVRFKFGNSMLPIDAIQATEYTSWSDEVIKVKVPNGLNSGDVKLLLNVGGFFSNSKEFKILQNCNGRTSYSSVTIGSQVWMVENLDVCTYRNGDPIPQVTDLNEWKNTTSGAWCYYNNDPATGEIYGKLYNWYAINDPRGIAPTGWHIPSDEEWTNLTDFLGGSGVAGGKMKESGLSHWNNPNSGATNLSGFTALPGGFRGISGSFTNISLHSYFWSSTKKNNDAWNRDLSYGDAGVVRDLKDLFIGHSVRCIKD